MLIGRRIVTVVGPGYRLTGGRGLDTSHGAGRLITTADGSITITIGPGHRTAITFANAVGGGPRWWRSYSTSHSATTSAGIRCRTIKEIRIRVTIVVTIVIGIEMVMEETAGAMVDTITVIPVV